MSRKWSEKRKMRKSKFNAGESLKPFIEWNLLCVKADGEVYVEAEDKQFAPPRVVCCTKCGEILRKFVLPLRCPACGSRELEISEASEEELNAVSGLLNKHQKQ